MKTLGVTRRTRLSRPGGHEDPPSCIVTGPSSQRRRAIVRSVEASSGERPSPYTGHDRAGQTRAFLAAKRKDRGDRRRRAPFRRRSRPLGGASRAGSLQPLARRMHDPLGAHGARRDPRRRRRCRGCRSPSVRHNRALDRALTGRGSI